MFQKLRAIFKKSICNGVHLLQTGFSAICTILGNFLFREFSWEFPKFPELALYKTVRYIIRTLPNVTAQKRKFSMKDFLFSKCDQIGRKLRIWPHLLKKSLMENFIFLCSAYLIKLFL